MDTLTVWFAIVLIVSLAIIQEKRHRKQVRDMIRRKIQHQDTLAALQRLRPIEPENLESIKRRVFELRTRG